MILLLDRAVERLRVSKGGNAAVEFAIIAPLAILIYAGASVVSDGVMTNRKLATLTRTLVDLTSQSPTSLQATSTPTPTNAPSASDLSNLFDSAQTLLYPEPTSPLTMTLSAIDVVNNPLTGVCCQATVRWSYTQGGTLRPCNTQLIPLLGVLINTVNTLPSYLLPKGTILPAPAAYLVADVAYTYQPIIQTGYLNFSPKMQKTEFMLPRSPGQVIVGPLPASGTRYGQVCY